LEKTSDFVEKRRDSRMAG